MTVVSTGKKVVMIEAGANEVDNDTMYRAIELAHNENQKQIELINRMVAEIGKPKFDYPTSWTRPRPPWIPTTRTSARPAGTR